jgi:bifunctional DNase/RNase
VLRVQVAQLAVDQSTNNPVVLLKAAGLDGFLPIWIGAPEASAIASEMAGHQFERPLTHDLLRSVVSGFGATVQRVTINELRGSTFFAKIYVTRDKEIMVIDARPSDSIALALRFEAPIFVDVDLFRENSRQIGTVPEEDLTGEDDPLRKYLEDPEPPDEFNL